jgi:hypothetical protein
MYARSSVPEVVVPASAREYPVFKGDCDLASTAVPKAVTNIRAMAHRIFISRGCLSDRPVRLPARLPRQMCRDRELPIWIDIVKNSPWTCSGLWQGHTHLGRALSQAADHICSLGRVIRWSRVHFCSACGRRGPGNAPRARWGARLDSLSLNFVCPHRARGTGKPD